MILESEIKYVKEYLKTIRELKREKFHLIEEYNDLPEPHSPSLEENRGTPVSQITWLNDYTQRKELLSNKITLFSQHIDNFLLCTVLLTSRQRQIIYTYLDAFTYAEMIQKLEDKYYISISTYKRELPEICLALAPFLQDQEMPTLEKVNQEFYEKYMKNME